MRGKGGGGALNRRALCLRPLSGGRDANIRYFRQKGYLGPAFSRSGRISARGPGGTGPLPVIRGHESSCTAAQKGRDIVRRGLVLGSNRFYDFFMTSEKMTRGFQGNQLKISFRKSNLCGGQYFRTSLLVILGCPARIFDASRLSDGRPLCPLARAGSEAQARLDGPC